MGLIWSEVFECLVRSVVIIAVKPRTQLEASALDDPGRT